MNILLYMSLFVYIMIIKNTFKDVRKSYKPFIYIYGLINPTAGNPLTINNHIIDLKAFNYQKYCYKLIK
jgi:hypothetical protein